MQSAASCRAWSHSAGAQWLQTTAGDQEGRLPATSKCCCFLRLKCSIPKVPLSAKQKQFPTGTRPCHRGTKAPQFSVFQRLSAVSGTHSPVGRGDGHVIFKLEDKVVLVQAICLWRKALGCLTEDEADAALVPAPGRAGFSVPSCRFRTRRRGQGQGSPESTRTGREEGASWPCFRPGTCLLAACVHFSVAGGSISKKFTSKAAPSVLQQPLKILVFSSGAGESFWGREKENSEKTNAQVTPASEVPAEVGAGVVVVKPPRQGSTFRRSVWNDCCALPSLSLDESLEQYGLLSRGTGTLWTVEEVASGT